MPSHASPAVEHELELIGGGRAFVDEITGVLINTPLFEALTPAELQTIAPFFQIYEMRDGVRIFTEGDPGSFLCVAASGKVDIVKSTHQLERVRLTVERTGRCFGEMALIDGEPRSATAICIEEGRLLALPRTAFEQVMDKHPVIALKLLRRMAAQLSQHLRRTTGMVVEHLATGG